MPNEHGFVCGSSPRRAAHTVGYLLLSLKLMEVNHAEW